jgi:hypothetical protein
MNDRSILISAGLAVALLAGSFGCASTKTVGAQQYGGRLERPDRILVYPFATSTADIQLDSSPTVAAAWKLKGISAPAERNEVAHQVADVVADRLVEKIQALGLRAERAAGPAPTDGGSVMAVTGHFLEIDEGSRVARITIGLGAGRSGVRTAVQLVQVSDAGRRIVDEFEIEAQSGRRPGAAETLGAGAAAGTLATAAVVTAAATVGSEAFGDDVEADGKRTADKVAAMLGDFFTQQGWIAPQ